MLNFVKVANQLDQEALPLFYDEGAFRIVLDIYLEKENEFRNIILMIGGFHTTKCVEHCIGKYIQGSAIEESLRQTQVFAVNVVDTILNGTNYALSLKGYLILASAIGKLKWETFSKHIDLQKFSEIHYINLVKAFQIPIASKTPEESKISYHICLNQCLVIKQEFEIFSKPCSERLEICRHRNGNRTLIGLLKNLGATDREGNWEGHLQVIQRLLPFF